MKVSAREALAAIQAPDNVAAVALLSTLGGRHAMVAPTIVITADEQRARADSARHAFVPPVDPSYCVDNPRMPWTPAAPLDAPGIDCTVIDRGEWEPAASVEPININAADGEPQEKAA